MKTMLIMVKMKKGRGSMEIFTMIAVTKNTSPMATRLPEMRICWGILQKRVSVRKTQPPKNLGLEPSCNCRNPSQTLRQETNGLPF